MFNCRRQRKPQAATGADTTGEVVYFLRGGDAIKIGYTTNLAARQRTLETGSAVPLELLASVAGDRREETRLHQEWWHLHIRGEWFRADEELLRYIRELAAGPLVVELSPAEREQEARFRRVLAAMDPADLPVIGMG
ncbi:MAG TPA: GIY-YIG nuclease family protein [Gemmataceae bacterium]|jgi:hypothetical protein